MENEITDEQWITAKERIDTHVDAYKHLLGQPGVMVGPALTFVLEPLLRRYNSGERTPELYREMMDVE